MILNVRPKLDDAIRLNAYLTYKEIAIDTDNKGKDKISPPLFNPFAEGTAVDYGAGPKEYVHICVQHQNGHKSLTTVRGSKILAKIKFSRTSRRSFVAMALLSRTLNQSPWKDGNDDVVGELAEAAHKADIQLGVYLSSYDRHEATYGKTLEYNEYYVAQMTELLTR
ncbi:hypothetical protein CTI12_AA126150 [Artemisia annua]|uniref:Uncharacterized protein n=1 Tax=Artemisia annua TaxID=35608 RepID=A0A2U1NP00_ARTAN|nr:hypothetical protein CTI12_AA126150 [Artemisia annua]